MTKIGSKYDALPRMLACASSMRISIPHFCSRATLLSLLLIALLLNFLPPADAANISSEAGTRTGQFLKFEPGGRQSGMGGTYGAYGEDVFALWGQPAAIASAPSAWQVGFQHAELFQDVTQEYLGIVGGLGDRSRIGLVVNTVGIDDLIRTSENAGGQLTVVGGTFGSRDISVALHYGQQLNEYITWGAAAKYIGSEIDDVRASGFAADLGVRMRLKNVEDLTLGASVTNVGTGLKYIRTRDDFPTTFRIGAAYRLRSLKLLLAADAVKSLDREFDAGVGAEWRPVEMLKLRVGYRSQGDDVDEGLTAGLGINLAGLEIDYAYVPYGVLGDAHRISAAYLFGGGREHLEPAVITEREATPSARQIMRARVLKRP